MFSFKRAVARRLRMLAERLDPPSRIVVATTATPPVWPGSIGSSLAQSGTAYSVVSL